MRNALSVAALLFVVALPASADKEVRHAFQSSIPGANVRHVVVDIPAAEVDLRNGTGRAIAMSGEVHREFIGDGRDIPKQQAIVDDISAVIRLNGTEAVIERKFGPAAGSWAAHNLRNNFRIRIEVPAGMDVEFETRYGEVRMEGEFGDIDVDLRAGEIHLRTPHDAVKDLNASVRVGEVHADFADERVNNEPRRNALPQFERRALPHQSARDRGRSARHADALIHIIRS